jgi:hypothetical protein
VVRWEKFPIFDMQFSRRLLKYGPSSVSCESLCPIAMDETILTNEEIESILQKSKNEEYSNPLIFNLTNQKTGIIKVNKTNGLILIYGNKHIGYNHIIERHSLTSRKQYWNNDGHLEDPTKFSLKIAPKDYLDIASAIYKTANINNKNNKLPQIFEIYEGEFRLIKDEATKYRLIVYKESKIIQSLFPIGKKIHNKKNIIPLRQGWFNSTFSARSEIETHEMPYFDQNDIPLYVVIIRYLPALEKEKWYIQINQNDGTPFLTKEIKTKTKQRTFYNTVKFIDFENFEWVEKIIKELMNENPK